MNLGIEGFAYLDTIGRGGFGAVHRAVDTAHGREVAVKILPAALDDSARRQFDRERRAMGTLSGHPGIGIVHTSGFTERGEPYIVMELLRGGSLADRIASGSLPVNDVVDIGASLADALAAAHDAGVLHLDVKPENILFSEFGTAKLVDFGIAALTDDEHATSTIRATPAYAAPEILEGRPATSAADVYGLAATLYAALMGSAPYRTGESPLTVLRSIAVDPVPEVTRHDAPTALVQLLRGAMDKDPAARPRSMREFAAALRSSRSARRPPPPPPPASSAPVPPTSGRGQRIGLALLGVAGVALVAVVIASLGGGGGPGDAAATTTSVASATTPDTTPDTTLDTTPETTPDTTPGTTGPTTTIAPTTTTNAPNALSASTLQWSSAIGDDDEPVDDLVVVPDRPPSLCITWSYSGLEPNSAFEAQWFVDGTFEPDFTGASTAVGESGSLWACVTNPNGLQDGAYEMQWVIDGAVQFSDSIYVGGGRRQVDVQILNDSETTICGVDLVPAAVGFWGSNRLLGPPIVPGSLAIIPVATGVYHLRVRDCANQAIFVDLDGVNIFSDQSIPIS